LVSPAFADRFTKKLTNCTLVRLGPGLHYLQEDHPEAIGNAAAKWIEGVPEKI